MRCSTILTTFLTAASLTSAAPRLLPRYSNGTYYGVSIAVVVSSGLEPNKVIEPMPVEINKYTLCDGDNGCSVSELMIQNDTATGGLDVDSIECRAYKDTAGVIPGSAVFNATRPALISTNLATISGVLCYIVTMSSA